MLKNKSDASENIGLHEEIKFKNNAIEVMEANEDNLCSRLDFLEDIKSNICATKSAMNLKIKMYKLELSWGQP